MRFKNADELIEFNRLDYSGTKFAKNKKYVLIKWENEMGDIVHPFDRIPMPVNEVPYTNTGMLGSQHSLIPEYVIQGRINLKNGIKVDKVEAIVYNADGSIDKVYKIKEDEINGIIQNVWKEQ